MGFVASLARGAWGARLGLPAGLTIDSDDATELVAVEPTSATQLIGCFAPGVSLVLAEAHHAELGRALSAYARALFEQLARAGAPPRTADPLWSPMVEVEHLRLDGQPALRMVA